MSLFRGMGVEVELATREDFLKCMETLTRVGLAEGNTLQQICFILHKRGNYAIMHHSEMKCLDGQNSVISEEDKKHRNTIAGMLHDWELVTIRDLDGFQMQEEAEPGVIKVINYLDKKNWKLVPQYVMGKKDRR